MQPPTAATATAAEAAAQAPEAAEAAAPVPTATAKARGRPKAAAKNAGPAPCQPPEPKGVWASRLALLALRDVLLQQPDKRRRQGQACNMASVTQDCEAFRDKSLSMWGAVVCAQNSVSKAPGR